MRLFEPDQPRGVTRDDVKRVLIVAAVLSVILALHAFVLEPASLQYGFHPVPAPPSLRAAAPLRIAVIADLHAGSPWIGTGKIDRVVASANAVRPDLILLAGDYMVQGVVGGTPMAPEVFIAHLKGLKARLGVYAVLGNHDRWESFWPHIIELFEAAGIRVLEDRTITVMKNGRRLNVTGIRDYATYPHDGADAMATIPAGESAICFTHSPDIFPLLPRQCALTIAGHTHGGQVWFPIVGRMIVPSQYGQRYATGLFSEGGKLLFVSNGIGTSILPVRFHVPPEISVLDME
jgi:predicted MPP superfamily phosphohydrolase